MEKRLFKGLAAILLMVMWFGSVYADTFQDFEDGLLTGWTAEGRQISGSGNWYGVSSYAGSNMGYLRHTSFTDLDLSRTFDYSPGMVLSFDAEFSINGDNSPSASGSSDFYSMVCYFINLYDADGNNLGEGVWRAAATTRYPYNNGWTEFLPNGLQHYEHDISSLASSSGVPVNTVKKVRLRFRGYSSWWSSDDMIVRFDNIRLGIPSTIPCECDLNHDGRCDMRDWLLFGRNWGRTNCPIQ
jgi:hypothetical protein